MSVFSTNQNRQFYVATKEADNVTVTSDAGEIQFTSLNHGVDKELYFKVKGADKDTVLRSDLIPVKGLKYVKATAAKKMATPLKSVAVTLKNDVNGGAPVAGQDYVLRINFYQFYGMSDGDQYMKDAVVRATKGMTAEQFYTAMVDALNLSFSRELGATKESNPYLTFEADNGIVITEKEQPWTLGLEAQESVLFDVVPTTIYVDGVEEFWGDKKDKTPKGDEIVVGTNAIGNGKKIADLEWFCMGERGDQYRMVGFPNYIPTHYLVDSTKEYNVLDIHYVFTDTGVNSYNSEKDITIVAENASVINALVKEINDATGLSITGTDGEVPE